MSTRRKYKSPPAYRDGGAVPSGAEIPDSVRALPVEPAPIEAPIAAEPVAAAPSPPQGDDGADALVRAYAGQKRAEELQRQAARQPRTVEEHIDQIPGLTSHKRAFLKQHPAMATDPEEARAMSFHYQASLARGIPDDSDAMNEAILAGMYREREFKDKAPPAAAADLATKAPMPAPRKSMPMSAPPSRAVPSYSSGKPVSNRMTLTPEEVQIARASIVDRPDMPKLTNEQREYIYAKNKLRYQQMKADGTYSEQGGGSPPLRAGYRDD